MNAVLTPPGLPPPAETALHTRRCVRHVEREAAARCPGCGRFFCRECVVEHGDRLLCTQCLAASVATASPRRRRWVRVRKALTFGAALATAWLAFYTVGSILLKLPPAFHEGTVWDAGNPPSP